MKLHTFESFVNTIKGSISERIEPIFEGGAAGHMMHPFDDAGLTFDDFRNMVEAGLSGELNFENSGTLAVKSGDAVVIPGAIPRKTGADYDIDKLFGFKISNRTLSLKFPRTYRSLLELTATDLQSTVEGDNT
mgnify:CR=1 FL=1